MKDSELVNSFYTRFVGLINQLKSHGETITDQRVVEKILRFLPPTFKSLFVILEEHTDMTAYNNLTQAEKDVLREQRKKDGKDMFYIHQAMHESILPRVATTINAKQGWETLETAYQCLDKIKNSNLQILRRDFESLSMKYS